MKIMIKSLLVAVGFALAACGGDSSSCKDQCDKLRSCAVSTSGVSCDASCSGQDATCAQCVNANACGDLKSKCATTCPTVHF